MSLIDDAPNKHGFPKNPVLERAMDEIARNDNAETRESLYKAMLATTFIAQGSISGSTVASDGKWIADSSTRVAFRTVEHPPGNIVLPVFTDAEALISWASAEVQWIAMPAQQLFQSIVPSNIAEVRVNPFKPGQTINRPGGVITRNEFVALTQGLLPECPLSPTWMWPSAPWLPSSASSPGASRRGRSAPLLRAPACRRRRPAASARPRTSRNVPRRGRPRH